MISYIVLICLNYNVSAYYLFPYGNLTNDRFIELQRISKCGPLFLQNKEFISNINIHSDGFIKFDENCFKLAIFNLKTWTSSNIYFREIFDSYNLSKYSQHVKKIKRYFIAKWGLQITWSNHIVNSVSRSENNSFQLIILTNGIDTYIIFNYFKMNIFEINDKIFIGFIDKKCMVNELINLTETNILQDSNIGKRGLYVFAIQDVFNQKINLGVKLKIKLFFLIYNFIFISLIIF